MNTPADKPDQASAVDPGAIDLEPIKENWQHKGFAPRHTIMSLIAAVEALRERVAELEHGYDVWCKTANQQADMRIAAEARVAALAGALEFYADPNTYTAIGFLADPPCGDFVDDFEVIGDAGRPGKRARTVLAATPAEALERARAVEEILRWAREMRGDGGAIRPYAFEEMENAFDKLDALGKEGE